MKTKKNIIMALGLMLVNILLVFSSCEKRPNEEKQRRHDNEVTFNAYADSTNFKKVSVDGSTAYVYMRWITNGTGTEHPIATSRVEVAIPSYSALRFIVKLSGIIPEEDKK